MSLDGRECGAQWLSELVPSVVEVSRALGRPPGLCVIHVGQRSDSQLYVSKKEDACKEVCISLTRCSINEAVWHCLPHAVLLVVCMAQGKHIGPAGYETPQLSLLFQYGYSFRADVVSK